MSDALTTEGFWDAYWAGIQLPALIDPRVQWQYALTQIFQTILPQNCARQLFEVGCAPGRWLVWFGKEFGYRVDGCDTSPRGVLLTRENLRINALKGEVYQADVMDAVLTRPYDVVVSLGVIEHFSNPTAIIRRHVELVKPGGLLVLEVPNMAGRINRFLLHAAGMDSLARLHNLRVMTEEFFTGVASEFGLKVALLAYIGGFDPGLVVFNYDGRQPGRRTVLLPLRGMARVIAWRPLVGRLLAKWNHPAWSHMLVGVFQRPG